MTRTCDVNVSLVLLKKILVVEVVCKEELLDICWRGDMQILLCQIVMHWDTLTSETINLQYTVHHPCEW